MKKYLSVFKMSLKQEFAYKLNFVIWRLRNVLGFMVAIFLWDNIFSVDGANLFGYDRQKIMTYIFLVLGVKALVMSARTGDLGGEISNGNILNFLVKPINYFNYWLSRDLSSKLINFTFAVIEFCLLFIIFRPVLYFQTNAFQVVLFLLSVLLGLLLFFIILFIVNLIPFWAPNMAWGAQFLIVVVITEFLSGAIVPLDVLPEFWQKIILFLPFAHLVYTPIQIYLGKFTAIETFQSLTISIFWLYLLWNFKNYLWKKGLKVYEAVGK